MSNKDLIIIEQLPVIRQTLEVMSAEIDMKVSRALALLCTEETVKEVKAVRAELTKDFTNLETKRITMDKKIHEPWKEFLDIYKELISDKFNYANGQLKEKIDEVEDGLKFNKKQDALRYFAELCASEKIDFVKFEQVGLSITLTVTIKQLMQQIANFIDSINQDLLLIDTQEFKNEILVEYRKSLSASKSIMDVVTRHKELEEQKERDIERKASRTAQNERIAQIDTFMPPPLEVPRIEPQSVENLSAQRTSITNKEYSASFKVYGTIDQLKSLKAFLISNNLKFENIPVPKPEEKKEEGKYAHMSKLAFDIMNNGTVPTEPEKVKEPEEIKEQKKDIKPIAFVCFRNKDGVFGGREYSYLIPEDIELGNGIGMKVDITTVKGIVSGMVTRIGTTEDVAAEILPKLKSIEAISKEEDGDK